MNLTWPFGLFEKSWILKKMNFIFFGCISLNFTHFQRNFFEWYFVDVFDKIKVFDNPYTSRFKEKLVMD